WTALLSGDDPQVIGRDLAYLGYVSRARADGVRKVRVAIGELASLRSESEARHRELDDAVEQSAAEKKNLEAHRAERAAVLAEIEAELAEQRKQAGHLQRNDERLSRVIET